MHKIYGWIPDIPDQRDYLYSTIKPKIKLPKEVDLSRFCSAVEAQGKLGSCTACALAGNLEFLDNKPDCKYTDVSKKCFLVRNSWGIKWGRAGYFTMPYEYPETLAADFWTIRK